MNNKTPRPKDLLEIIYDTLAGNEVEPTDKEYMLNAINHIDYGNEEITFTHNGEAYAISITEINTDRVQ